MMILIMIKMMAVMIEMVIMTYITTTNPQGDWWIIRGLWLENITWTMGKLLVRCKVTGLSAGQVRQELKFFTKITYDLHEWNWSPLHAHYLSFVNTCHIHSHLFCFSSYQTDSSVSSKVYCIIRMQCECFRTFVLRWSFDTLKIHVINIPTKKYDSSPVIRAPLYNGHFILACWWLF